MPHFYLGQTTDGRIVSRKSTRNDFTHAAIYNLTDYGAGTPNPLPSFGTSHEGAVRNFHSNFMQGIGCEVVLLRKVDSPEYRAATKGINPRTGRPSAA